MGATPSGSVSESAESAESADAEGVRVLRLLRIVLRLLGCLFRILLLLLLFFHLRLLFFHLLFLFFHLLRRVDEIAQAAVVGHERFANRRERPVALPSDVIVRVGLVQRGDEDRILRLFHHLLFRLREREG